MTAWVDSLKETIPDYAKDTKLNLDAVIKRSSIDVEQAECIALAAAFATGNTKVWTWIESQIANKTETHAALTAGAIMAQNNVWYPYVEMAGDENLSGLPAQLSASIVGKCHFCVKAHYETLKQEGYSVEQLRDIGRIASVMNSLCKVMAS